MFKSTKILKTVSLILSFSFSLFAGYENYLKKVEGKSDIHNMPGIDFIYMINLDKRPEKFAKSCEQLHPYGIFPYRFSAVNGWELTVEAINEIGLKYKKGMQRIMATCYPLDGDKKQRHEMFGTDKNCGYFCHCLAPGTIGIFLSHISILLDAYNSGYNTIWIMEDDIEVIRDPRLISEMIENLDNSVRQWDILFTDLDIRNNTTGEYVPCGGYAKRPNFTPKNPGRFKTRQKIGKHFIKIGSRFGAHSYIVRRSGIEKILNFYKTYGPYLPYDMDNYLPNGIRMYTVRKDIVANLVGAPSDNGTPPPQ
jgi:GR25 family glycosyltransferase involved in LPS biosynthesis